MKTPGFEADKDRMFVMEMETGKMDYVTENLDQDAQHIVWSDDGNSIYFISGVKATYQVYSADLDTKKITQHTHGNHDYISFVKASTSTGKSSST